VGTQKHKSFELPKDFSGIEEVEGYPEGNNIIDGGIVGIGGIEDVDSNAEEIEVIDGGQVKATDIEEVEVPSQEDGNVAEEGPISWERLEISHKRQMRVYITAAVLSLWVLWTIVGLVMFTHTGNSSLLISSPATVGGVALYRILFKIVKYYF
jgi:hypothetical protein